LSDKFTTECTASAEMAGKTLSAVIRMLAPEMSWRQVKRLIETRRVQVNGRLSIDESRRIAAEDQIDVVSHSLPKPPDATSVVIRHLDESIVVVEKPPGVVSERHRSEINWPGSRRLVQPALEEMVLQRLPRSKHEKDPALLGAKQRRQLVRCVHRLDQDTSGLLVFARTTHAELSLVSQFTDHSIERAYLAIVLGAPEIGTIESNLVRDRGDGQRGSSKRSDEGKRAETIIRSVQPFGEYSLVECELKTGRTHQIRIHLSEQGHPVCGDSIYRSPLGEPPIIDASNSPRLALHARRLAFVHPESGENIAFDADLPADLAPLVNVSDDIDASDNVDESDKIDASDDVVS
jgi:23S rRNA pseudouridine1911/1915/1917 synthase